LVEIEVEVTRLVEIEVEVTRLVEVAPTAPPPPTPAPAAAIEPTSYLATANITPDDLPAGGPGLSVIAQGQPSEFGSISVVVRNNVDAPVYNVEISATARDEAGGVLGTGSGLLFAPSYVPPGSVAFGTVGFMDTDLDGATIDYRVTAQDAPSVFLARRDLEVLEHNIVGNNIVGILLNSNDAPLDLVQGAAICFDDDLVPIAAPSSFTDQGEVDANAELPFSVNLFSNTASCSRYFLAAHGFETN